MLSVLLQRIRFLIQRSSVFGKKLNDFLPGIRKSRITIKKERKNIYELIDQMSRDEFIRINKLHSIIWDEDDSLVSEFLRQEAER